MSAEKVSRFPLQWPAGWKRTENYRRTEGRFSKHGKDISVFQAAERLIDELKRMAISENDVVLSTNVQTRLDGMPRSDRPQPSDPGAAVYWRDGGTTRCMAIDRYSKVEQNIAGLAATIEAMRAIERHGGAVILERAFQGFASLPPPGQQRSWREILGAHPATTNVDAIRTLYQRRRSETHPDKGGAASEFALVEKAWQAAQQELR